MTPEEAFAAVVAPYRDAARRRVERGTALPASELGVVDSGTFVTYSVAEDVNGTPAHMERHAETLGEWSDSARE